MTPFGKPDSFSLAKCRLLLVLTLSGCATLSQRDTFPEIVRAQSGGSQRYAQSQPEVPTRSGAVLALTLRDAVEQALRQSDVIRVLNSRVDLSAVSVFDSMIADYETQALQGKFLPSLSVTLDESRVNEPPNAFFGPGISARTRRDTIDFRARMTKALRNGGEVSLGIEPPLAYLYFPDGVDPGEFNPTWSAEYVFRFNQPLLRGAGTDIATAPIRIAQLNAEQSRWAVQEQLNAVIRSVCQAYWALYAANVELRAIRGVIPLAEESVRIERLRFEAEQTIYADLARAQFQLEGFRQDEALAAARLRRRVLQLRALMGASADVDPLLFPVDQPTRQPPVADGHQLADVATSRRPALNQLRELVQQRFVELSVRDNALLPQLDFRADYRTSGLAGGLSNAAKQASEFDYTDWTVGFGLDVPLGNMTARSQRQVSELQLTKDQIRLQKSEQNVRFEVMELHSELIGAWERYLIASRQAAQTQEWLRLSRLRYADPPAASSGRNWMLLELSDYQSAMRSYIDAVTGAGQAIAEYNTRLAELSEAQGLSMESASVYVNELHGSSQNGPLSQHGTSSARPLPGRYSYPVPVGPEPDLMNSVPVPATTGQRYGHSMQSVSHRFSDNNRSVVSGHAASRYGR